MEYEKCYLFRPSDDSTRPVKRRRTEPTGLQASWAVRREAYQAAWLAQQERIDAALSKIDSETVSEISTFLDDLLDPDEPRTRIPTAIVLGSPDATSLTQRLLGGKDKPGGRSEADARRLCASLSSSSGTNLKAVLKTLIHRATDLENGLGDEEEDDMPNPGRKGPRLLNYDLQILADFVRERKIKQVIIAFEDTEAFDSNLLSELTELLGHWLDRIPFVCLFSIATSLDFLQQRLSREAVKCLEGRLFDVAPSVDNTQQVFNVVVGSDPLLWIGSSFASMAVERQSDYIQSIDSFVDAVRYAYMSHYYANALSIFLIPGISLDEVPGDHFEAMRNLDSFRTVAQSLLDDGEVVLLKELLDSDEKLHKFAKEQITRGQAQMAGLAHAIDVLCTIQHSLPNTPVSSKSSLFTQAMSGKLHGSALIRSLLLAIRKSPSNTAITLLQALVSFTGKAWVDTSQTLSTLLTSLETLLSSRADDATRPLRSADDLQNSTSTLRTTVVAQKIALSKQKSTLSAQDSAYTTLLRTFTDTLETFFTTTLLDPKTLPFHEIYLYDLKSPHQQTFAPRPRHAVERALALPQDYLDCACCAPSSTIQAEGGEESTLSASQPATAVLYQLYLESGSLINVKDLWTAFQAVMGGDEDSDEKGENEAMALFQRGLGELRYLGLVKGTRKRVDHVSKVSWRGL